MKTIIFPLNFQTRSAEVGDLQQALIQLGSQIARPEKNNQRYGASTRAAVLAFQTAHQLPGTGEVDAATAGVLNNILAELDPPGDKNPARPIIKLRGQIIDQTTRKGLGDLRVEAWDPDVNGNVLLGDALTDAQGRFAIDFDQGKFKDNGADVPPDLFFKILSGGRVVFNSEAQPINEWTAPPQPFVIEVNPQPPTDDKNPAQPIIKLRGQIINQTTRNGLPDLRVEAWDPDVNGNVLLGDALTDAQGRFAIDFDQGKFKDNGADVPPDLFLKILSGGRIVFNSEAQPINEWTAPPQPFVIEVNPQPPTDDKNPGQQTIKLRGQIINQTTRNGLPDLKVEAWDPDVNGNVLLGDALTDAQGRFAIDFDQGKFKDNGADAPPDLFLKILSGSRTVFNSEAKPINEWTAPPQPFVIEVIPKPPTPEVEPFVEGEVVQPDGTPLQNYPVRAFDRSICNLRPLGEARTNDLGHYRINYQAAELKSWGKTRADLKVQVYDPQGFNPPTVETILASSPLMLQALPKEVVNFSIGQGSYRGPSEYSLVQSSLDPLVLSVNNLSCVGVADVMILARDSKLSNGSVANYVKSRRWATELDASPAMFYGLLRQRQPTRIDAMFARPFSQLWKALEKAKARNVINLTLDDALRNRLTEIQQNYLARPDHPFRQLLQTTALSAEQQSVFTLRLTTGDLSVDEFWKSLETHDGFTVQQIDELKAAQSLQFFTDDNTSLSIHLRSGLNVRQPREVATFSVEKWRDQVLTADNVEIPEEILPGEPEVERRAAYAQMLYRSAELQYPTPSLAGQMSRTQGWANQPLSAFLAAYPDFEFDALRIPFFLQQHPEAVKLFPDPKTGRQELLRFEQMFHLAPSRDRLAAIQPLWNAGLRSARQIAMGGRHQLLRKVGNSVDKSVANGIYQKAVHTTGVALNVYLRYQQGLNGRSLYAMRTGSELPGGDAVIDDAVHDWWETLPGTHTEQPGTETDLPEWSELFGSADACECSHCQSAFSPAAYLVDMMYFLQRATDGAGKTALDHLLDRRPDLGTLELTCQNTETLMPQIDLGIEIMGQIVGHSTDGTSIPEGSIGQTTWESELLAAQPEHEDPAPYEKLREAAFPFNRLPFDLWLEEARLYLKQMGVARDELMRVMPPKTGVGALQIAGETLRMSTLEREIVRVPKTGIADVALYWGVDTGIGTLQEQLGQVDALMKQARIDDYDTLLRLLNTRYVNPDRLISVTFKGNSCSLDKADFAGPNGAAITNEDFRSFLDRLHRFLRLQQRLGWSEYELDATIKALGVEDFNQQDFLAKIADLTRLRELFDLPVDELCSWWVNLDTYQFEDDLLSQYEEVFLDPAVVPDTHTGAGPDLRNEVFALRRDRLDLVITEKTTSTTLSRWLAESDGATEPAYSLQQDYAAYIQSATRLTAEDILLLAGEVLSKDPTTGNVPLDLANVSLLYRMGSFTRALDLSVQEYLDLVRLVGKSPLMAANGAASPLDSMVVYERLNEINEGNWSLEELAYLLLHDAATAITYGPTAETMDAVLSELSQGFVGIDKVSTARASADLLTSLSQSLGASLQLDAAILEELLFALRTSLGDQLLANLIAHANLGFPIPTTSFYDVYETLHKFAMVWNGLGLDPTQLAFVVDQDLGWPDMASLPLSELSATNFGAWRRLTQAAKLQLSVFSVEQSLFGLLESAKGPALSRESFLAQTSEWSGWSLEDLTYLTGPEGYNYLYPDAFLDERWLVALEKVFDVVQPLGVSAAQAHAWAAAELTFAETESIKQALTLAYDRDRWLEVMAGIQDELRTLKRDALLAYLLKNLASDDPYDVYRHYLFDPEMAPCARTSRIVEAHAAVQLFAQRILLNLEPPLSFPSEDAEGWKWRKNYRIWEAARKVLLYPENWIEPELRDNKSVFFKELEDGLFQDDVTFLVAERLYHEYLTKLDQVSHLEIMGMYQDQETNVLHVFGRTREIPTLYYYRRWEEKARWTPWERVDLDIQSDHLIPIVYNGQLYLFWPQFKVTGPESSGSATAPISDPRARSSSYDPETGNSTPNTGVDFSPPDDIPVDEPDKPTQPHPEEPTYQVELSMAWSQYNPRGWSAKTISSRKVSYGMDESVKYHFFTGWISSEDRLHIALHINRRGLPGDVDQVYLGYFYFDDCHGELLFDNSVDGEAIHPNGEVYVSSSMQSFQSLVFGNPTWSLTSFGLEVDDSTIINADGSTRPILNKLTWGGQFHYAHQYGLGGAEGSPFFFSDTQRTYFVRFISEITHSDFAFESASLTRSKSAQESVRKQSNRTAIPENLSPQFTVGNGHYGGITDGVISRVDPQTLVFTSAQQTSTLAKILAVDENPEIPPDSEQRLASYLFTRFYHPYTSLFLRQLSRYGIEGFLNPDPEWDEGSEKLYRQLTPDKAFFFKPTYDPEDWVDGDYPLDDIDFDHNSAYGEYNWEIFFHIPLLIATRLMQNQRFAEARRWFNYIFDATHTDGKTPARFWKIRPFYEEQLKGSTDTLQELMDLLEEGSDQLEQQVDEWASDPFNPHAIARLRMAAYMKTTVMKYLDCLIAEADMLFTIDIRETINEGAQLYLLAADILGEKPVLVPAKEAEILTANDLLGRISFSLEGSEWNPLDALNSLLSTRLSGGSSSRATQNLPTGSTVNTQGAGVTAEGATTSYDTLFSFCLPNNEKLYGYWDTVADRLFKIRHCMNIAGVVRQLPLFAPPIDPALLVRASAAGLDLASILSTLYEPLPKYRFGFMLQKAMELCSEVRSLGSELLSALEKKDAEGLSQLRSAHEVSLLQAIGDVKKKTVEESQSSLESLVKNKESAELRRVYYSSQERVSRGEENSLEKQEDSRHRQRDAEIAETLASILHPIPSFPNAAFGGPNLGSSAQAVASSFRGRSAFFAYEANKASIMAGYDRRQKDWNLQAQLAQKEIEQLDKQILTAEIRLQIGEADLKNHEKQIAQAEEAEAFLTTKFTNQELYSWTVTKLSTLYFQTYQMAHKLAKQAEKCFQHELGPDEKGMSFITGFYWDSLKKGLCAAEQLNYDLRRMENAHQEANLREFEMTKHISLMQFDPTALVSLRETGSCEVHMPEVLFAMDFPNHYFRRIKAVRVTIPCVVGPYANVNATLNLTESWIRSASDAAADLESVTGLPQSSIATSSAKEDGGAFELAFNDPRYLPFEGAGAISSWRLELPTALRSFDYDTINDVIIHLSYTAREAQDGGTFKDAVNGQLVSSLNDLNQAIDESGVTLSRLFSLRQEFAADWSRLLSPIAGEDQQITLNLSKQHFPRYLDYLWEKNRDGILKSQPITLQITSVNVYLNPKGIMPSNAEDIKINEIQGKIPASQSDIPGLLSFDSVLDTSIIEIGNESGVDLELTVSGELRPEHWKDLYVLARYQVTS